MTIPPLAIIIPVYNPPKKWAAHLLEQVNEFLKLTMENNVQLVIVNDGSVNTHFKDEINTIVQNYTAVVVVEFKKNSGKGFALRQGVSAINAPFYIVTDVDFPYTTESMIAVYKELQTGNYDIAAGNRNRDYYNRIDGFRKNLSLLLRYFIRKRLQLITDDTQCGLKGFNEAGKQLFLQTTINRYLYDLEFMVKAGNSKAIRLKSVPVFLRTGIVLRSMPFPVLLHETGNFLSILFFRNKL